MRIRSSLLYARKLLLEKRSGGHGKKTLLGAVICIGISLVPLVAVLAISDGMISGITGRIIRLWSQDIAVYIEPDEPYAQDAPSLVALAERLCAVSGVTGAIPEVQGTALAVGPSVRSGATVRAVPRDIFLRNEGFRELFTVVEGSTALDGDRTAVICTKLAGDLGVHAGDTIRLVTAGSVSSGETVRIIPKISVFTVGGIVSCGYQELDALWTFVPLEAGFAVLGRDSAQYGVSLVTDDPFSAELPRVTYRVQQNLYGADGEDAVLSASVYPWNELNSSQYENFASTKVLLMLIMLLIVLVASINISSALVMMVMERKREIAILRSVGASGADIALSFVFAGFASGLGGTLMGIPAGLLAAVNINAIIRAMERAVNAAGRMWQVLSRGTAGGQGIRLLDPAYYLQQIPVTVPFTELLVIATGTLALSLLASVVPAVRAGMEKPIDTLRKL